MRTRVLPAPTWNVSTIAEHGRTILIVEGGLRIEIEPLIPLPGDRGAWAANHVSRDLPDGARLELVGHAQHTTRANAPMTLVTAKIRDATGKICEVRQVAFYVFGDRGGVVMARVLEQARDRFEVDLEYVLRTAHVATVEPARIDDLYE